MNEPEEFEYVLCGLDNKIRQTTYCSEVCRVYTPKEICKYAQSVILILNEND